MTPINAIASIPPNAPGLESGAGRSARQAAPEPETDVSATTTTEQRSFWDRLWGKEGFSFGALLDVVNPLQHIPVVATIYRAASGDTIGPAPRVIGGAIFGGVVGLITSAADAVVEGVTGKDTGSHILAMLPEPDPTSNWADADNEDPRHRGLMTAVLNLPNDSPTQFASDDATANTTADSATTQNTREAATPTTRDTATQAARDAATAAAFAAQGRAAAMNPAAMNPNAQSVVPASTRPFAAPARAAQSGAGGQVVPLANHGRPVAKLPSPKELAANPALLQEMRQGGAAAINTPAKNTGRIDTAIKGHGLLAPGAARPEAITTPAAFDAQTDSQLNTRDDRTSDAASMRKPSTQQPAARDTSAMPEVSPDFLMKMQQALEKYQSMRTAPTVDVSH